MSILENPTMAERNENSTIRDSKFLSLSNELLVEIIKFSTIEARLQTDPAGRAVGLWVPAPWVGSAIFMGT
jgi:hypothetical protein